MRETVVSKTALFLKGDRIIGVDWFFLLKEDHVPDEKIWFDGEQAWYLISGMFYGMKYC